ncbi:MAG: glycosyltransferase [Planctomycetes bacterium]|nr:glycosyltransferase [Planctomycetota bacterium]
MRIIHLTHQYLPETRGGVESYVHTLAQHQASVGHHLRIVSGSFEPRDAVTTVAAEVDGIAVRRVHRADPYFDRWDRMDCPETREAVVAEVESFRPDVVHLHHWIRLAPDLVERLGEAGFPVVVTLHDLSTTCPRAFRLRPGEGNCLRRVSVESCLDCVPRWPWSDDRALAPEIEHFVARGRHELLSAQLVICASPALRDLVQSNLGVAEERFRIAPLGYEPRFAGMDAEPVPDEAPFRFGYWGAITARKGVDLAIEALRSLNAGRRDGHRPVSLELFGGFDHPDTEADLRLRAEGLPVTFHGRFDYADLPRAGLSAAVFPSRCFETYGIVLDEALELKLPVIVPDLGALPDRAGDAGLIFSADDAGSLARAMGALADDPSIRQRCRDAMVGRAGPDLGEHAAAIEAIYRDAGAMRPFRPSRRRDPAGEIRRVERERALFRRLLEREGP